MDQAAQEMLVHLIGNNLQELSTQIEKVATFIGEKGAITVDDVRQAASDTKVDTVFDLANAFGDKDMVKALRRLHTMLRDGEAPLMILSMLTRHFRQLRIVRELLEKKMPPQEISKAAGINPYFINGVIAQAKNYRLQEFHPVFEKLYATDLALKTSGGRRVRPVGHQVHAELAARRLDGRVRFAGGRPQDLMERLAMDICSKT